jgi:hypothetical protein
MKTFINKKTQMSENIGDSVRQLGFFDLVRVGLNSPPQEGWTPGEMRVRFKLEDKIADTELDKTIELEDADFEKVYTICKSIKWAKMHRDIVAFDDYLDELNKGE